MKEEIAKTALNQAVLVDHEVLRDEAGELLVAVEQKPDTFYVRIEEKDGETE